MEDMREATEKEEEATTGDTEDKGKRETVD